MTLRHEAVVHAFAQFCFDLPKFRDEALSSAVWEDVCSLLREPERIEDTPCIALH